MVHRFLVSVCIEAIEMCIYFYGLAHHNSGIQYCRTGKFLTEPHPLFYNKNWNHNQKYTIIVMNMHASINYQPSVSIINLCINFNYLRYSSTITSLYHAWTCMVPRNITGGFFWEAFVFHVCLFTLHEHRIIQFLHIL